MLDDWWKLALPKTITPPLGGAAAKKIYAVDIQADENGNESADCLIVELPDRGSGRRLVFDRSNQLAQKFGFEPEAD